MQLMTKKKTETMSSSQLADLLNKKKKHVNESIRKMFSEKIDGQIIRPSLDSRGYVVDYHLPELESKSESNGSVQLWVYLNQGAKHNCEVVGNVHQNPELMGAL